MINPFCNFPTQRIIIENQKINKIYDKSSFKGKIDFAGCSNEIDTQENHILTATGGEVSPKNIILQTKGSESDVFGSFFRDDTLTDPKGDVRGTGANDLSVSRDLCSQVASGAFSCILSGENNTSSSEGSIVIGGNSNIADGSNCLVMGGLSNRSGGGFNNGIITGSGNSISRFRNDISNIFIDISNSMIMTGTNIIMNGNSSVFVTGKDISGTPIVPGTTNLVPQFRIPYSNSAILTGLSNTIIPVTPNVGGVFGTTTVQQVFIGTGRNNKIANWYPILTGSDITFGFNGSFLSSFIYTGKNISNKAIVGSDKYYWNTAFMSSESNIGDFNTSITRDFGFLPGSRNNNSGSGERQGGLIGGIFNRLSSFNTAIVTGSNIQTINNQGNTSGCSFFGTGINQGIGGVNTIFNTSTIITGSNNSLASGVNNGYICGRVNVAGGNSTNMLLGGSSNTCANNITNCSIISGAGNGNTTASNSVIGSGINNIINGAFTNSFMTGVGGFLSTPPFVNSAAVFGQSNLQGATGTPSSNRIFMIGNGTGTRRNAFSITENGVVRAQRVFSTGGADFAEYFESYQGLEKLPLHESVCLIDDRFLGKKIENGYLVSSEDGFQEKDLGKIILASQVPDEIEAFGVITNNSSYIGNAYDEEWQGKYEKDENGNFIYYEQEKIEFEDVFDLSWNEVVTYKEERRISDTEIFYQKVKSVETQEMKIPVLEEVPLYSESGELLSMIEKQKKTKIVRKILIKKISDSYNPNQIYVPRSKRPEWNLVALRGQILIKKAEREIPNSIRLEEYNSIYNKYLI